MLGGGQCCRLMFSVQSRTVVVINKKACPSLLVGEFPQKRYDTCAHVNKRPKQNTRFDNIFGLSTIQLLAGGEKKNSQFLAVGKTTLNSARCVTGNIGVYKQTPPSPQLKPIFCSPSDFPSGAVA